MMNCVVLPQGQSFVAGAGDATSGKIFQWDLREKEPTLIYNHHLAPCNSITFIDDGKSFSTGDDKKIFVWEYNPYHEVHKRAAHAPVPIVRKHPTQQFWCGQHGQLDSAYGGERVKQQRKRTFKGHLNSGYAAASRSARREIFAPGDGEGRRSSGTSSRRGYRKLQAHDAGPCIDCAWHPPTSWVARRAAQPLRGTSKTGVVLMPRYDPSNLKNRRIVSRSCAAVTHAAQINAPPARPRVPTLR